MSEEKEEVKSDGWLVDTLSTITNGLDTYAGRDAAVVMLSFPPLLVADLYTYNGWSDTYAEACVNAFLALSSCRIMMRLFDAPGCIREYFRFQSAQNTKVLTCCLTLCLTLTLVHRKMNEFIPCLLLLYNKAFTGNLI